MRAILMVLPLAMTASPVAAQSARAPVASDTITVPPQLTDPKFADRLTDVMQAMTGAFLDLPVGEVQAAMEGRKPTAADRRRTVASETRLTEQQLSAQIEQNRPMVRAGLGAMAKALPAMMKGMTEAAREMEKATSNLPQPGYPKR